MQVQLICSDNIKAIMTELLSTRGIGIDEDAQICLAEKGEQIPDTKVGILFEMTSLKVLMELLNHFIIPLNKENSSIVGRLDEERYELIPYSRVCCFEGRGNFVFCITAAGEFRIKEKLYELEMKLPKNRFIRVSKSYIVNISNIKEIIPWFGGRLVLRFTDIGKEVEVSRSQVRSFREFLDM